MKLKTLSVLCLSAGTLFSASSAMAWTSADGAWTTSASVALTSDYMWRGASQTKESPAIQGSFDIGHSSGFYAGTWASNVDFHDSEDFAKASTEIDLYAGFANTTDSGLGYDFSFLRYTYDNASVDWNEISAKLTYSYFNAGIAYSNDAFSAGKDATYYSVGFDYDLPYNIALSAGVGYYDISRVLDHDTTDYHIGVSTTAAGFGWDLSYIDSNGKTAEAYASDDLTDGRFVFTISKSL